MVLLPDGRAKIRAEGFAIGEARGRAKARAEVERDMDRVHAAWTGWLERMEDCHARGEPFKEPTPDPAGERPKGWYEGWDKGWTAGWIEGRTIGARDTVAQTYSAWADWNAQRIAHENRGETFYEPPPAPPDGWSDGKGNISEQGG